MRESLLCPHIPNTWEMWFLYQSKQILHAFTDDVRLRLVNKSYVLENIRFNSHPAIVHGNGLSKLTLNSYTNYIPNKWSPELGCNTCYDNILDLSTLKVLLLIKYTNVHAYFI